MMNENGMVIMNGKLKWLCKESWIIPGQHPANYLQMPGKTTQVNSQDSQYSSQLDVLWMM
jgi:hypothetical protein